MELFLLLEEEAYRHNLEQAIVKATTWQISRVKTSGEVSTEGNTRVFEGGETFLGEEKRVDYAKTVKALYYFGVLTDSEDVIELGDSVLDYYN